MAFWRVRGQSISLLHGRRTASGVKQSVLHTFADFAELGKTMQEANWVRFTQTVEQAHPRVAPRWDQLREQASRLLEQAEPASAAQDWSKLRKALKYAATHLYPSVLTPVDENKTMALAPELLDCLEAGLMRILGRDEPSIAYLVPNQERTDGLVERARETFFRDGRKGARLFQEARHYNPYDPDVLVSWGCCHFEKQNYKKARELFQQARQMAGLQLPEQDKVYSWGNIRIRPYFRATCNLAMALQKEGRLPEALELFQHCLERCPDDGVGARYHLAPIYERLSDLEQALRLTREHGNSSFMEMPDAHYDLVRLLIKLGRTEEALAPALRGLSINPWIPACLAQKSNLHSFRHAALDSIEWAENYARESRELWTAESRSWLQKLCKHRLLAPLLTSFKECLLEPGTYQEQRQLSKDIRKLEHALCNSPTRP
ncbi:MAG: tetratricopeptide repeat protein [Vulcanimicrobiota bacterium]